VTGGRGAQNGDGRPGEGQVWVVDAYLCSPSRLRSPAVLGRLFRRIVEGLDLHPVGQPRCVRFPSTGGLTLLWMLKESHLACHTFPEFGSACLDLFSCHPVRPWPWRDVLCRALGARRVRLRCLERRYSAAGARRRGKEGTSWSRRTARPARGR
jgi:S-adenosylmethionine decarboxylase